MSELTNILGLVARNLIAKQQRKILNKKSYVYNDGGRKEAGFKGDAGDCVTRSIAIAAELPYIDVYNELNVRTRAARKSGNRAGARTGIPKSVWKSYLEELGWTWTATMGIGTGCKVHLRGSELPEGRLIVRCTRHLVAVIDGEIHDTHDSSHDGSRCVYGYWRKPCT